MKRVIIILPLALAACNSKSGSQAATGSPIDVEARMAAAMKLQPGNWATKFQIVKMEMAGASAPGARDPKAAEAINQAMVAHGADASAFENCISLAQAAKPLSIMLAGNDVTGCRYDNFTAANGKIAAKMTCKRGKGTMTRTLSGSYSAERYAFTSEMVGDGKTKETALRMKTQTSAARVGACPVDTKNTV